jgi:tight adherence protein B
MELLLIAAVFGITLASAMALGKALDRRHDPVGVRLERLASLTASPRAHAERAASGPSPSVVDGEGWPKAGVRPRPRGLQLALLQAGLKFRPAEYRLATLFAAATLGGIGCLMPNRLVGIPVLVVAGLAVPPVLLRRLQAARLQKFESQMPDTLTLMASSLRSGYSFLQALQVVGQEMPDPIREEFRRVVAESTLGMSAEQSLGRLVERTPSYDLELVVTAVNIQLQVGGNLSQILDTVAATIRERVRNQREIAALTAEGKLSAIVCAALPSVMGCLLTILNPAYMKPLFTHPFGWAMIAAALLLQGIGILWLRVLIRIDV